MKLVLNVYQGLFHAFIQPLYGLKHKNVVNRSFKVLPLIITSRKTWEEHWRFWYLCWVHVNAMLLEVRLNCHVVTKMRCQHFYFHSGIRICLEILLWTHLNFQKFHSNENNVFSLNQCSSHEASHQINVKRLYMNIQNLQSIFTKDNVFQSTHKYV